NVNCAIFTCLPSTNINIFNLSSGSFVIIEAQILATDPTLGGFATLLLVDNSMVHFNASFLFAHNYVLLTTTQANITFRCNTVLVQTPIGQTIFQLNGNALLHIGQLGVDNAASAVGPPTGAGVIDILTNSTVDLHVDSFNFTSNNLNGIHA